MHARLALLALLLLIAPAARAQVGADWTAATGGSIRPGYDLNSCGAANSGALRYNTAVNQFQVCYGSGGWATLADASGTTPFYTDRITSGTAGVFVSNTGVINFRTGDVTTGYFDAAGLLVTPGISITTANGISSTNGYFSGDVILSNAASIRVSGTVFTVSYSNGSLFTSNNPNYFDIQSTGSVPILRLFKSTTTWSIGFPGSPNATSDPWQRGLWFVPNYTTTGMAVTPTLVLENNGAVGIGGVTQPNASLEVSGTVSATAFVGNGSGLTGLTGDRITSGTAGVFVSNTGIINFRTGGVTTGYFDASGLLVAPGISITTANGISSTIGYFTQKSFFGDNASALASSVSASHIISGTLYIAPSALNYSNSNDGFLTVKTSNGGAFFVGRQVGGSYVSNKAIFTAITDNPNGASNIFFQGWVSGTDTAVIRADGSAYFATKIGVGVRSPSTAIAMEVSGTVSATAFVGNGAGLTNLNVQGDRITSGTAGVFVSSTGIINFRTGGVTTGYFDAAGLLVAPGISITTANGISSTNGYFSGAVVNAPQANAGTSIDWSRGNVQYTSASCGAFTFTNMQDGGVYSLTVKGTAAGTCSFSQSGLTFRMPPNHGTVSTGTMTFYTFTRSGSDVMVNWMPGY